MLVLDIWYARKGSIMGGPDGQIGVIIIIIIIPSFITLVFTGYYLLLVAYVLLSINL
jgi:hypothetical protein